jgi:hypothetical protein
MMLDDAFYSLACVAPDNAYGSDIVTVAVIVSDRL